MKIMNRAFEHLKRKQMLNWLPDSTYLKLAFYFRTGNKLNLKNPETFNEKLQWLKLNDRNSEYTRMVDKYEAKRYVAERIGEQYIIPTLGVWNGFDDIDFDSLPEQFILKCTHDSGGLVICKDKSKLNKDDAKKKIENSLETNYYLNGREWPYKNVKPRIIVEQYMENGSRGLVDYKFYCFNGKPRYLYVSEGLENHATANISFVNIDYTQASFGRSDYKPFENLPPKPECFEKMKQIAAELSGGLPFLRVDLYEIDGKIYFSELTFTPCGGMMPFDPPEYDKVLGDMIHLNK